MDKMLCVFLKNLILEYRYTHKCKNFASSNLDNIYALSLHHSGLLQMSHPHIPMLAFLPIRGLSLHSYVTN